MATGAHYQINQAANAIPTGTVDVARIDIRQGQVCHFIGDSSSGQTNPAWTITAWPDGSARAAFTNSTTYDASYTPDVPGSYRGQFLVGDGLGPNAKSFIFRVTRDSAGVLIDDGFSEPAFGELVGEDNAGGNDRGYAKAFETGAKKGSFTVDTMAALRLTKPVRFKRCRLVCYATPGDGGGGEFIWRTGSPPADDGGINIVVTGVSTGWWQRQYSGPIAAKAFGAKGDARRVQGVATTATSNQITAAGLTAADITKTAWVTRGGPSGGPLVGTISNVVGTTVTLSVTATSSTAGGTFIYGTNDTAAIQAAWDACDDVYHPEGTYLESGLHALAAKHLHGAGKDKTFLKHIPGSANAAAWLGNNTENLPSVIYAAQKFNVHDMSIEIDVDTKWGLRCRELSYSTIKNMYVGVSPNDKDPSVVGGIIGCKGVAGFFDGALNCQFSNLDFTPNDQTVSFGAQVRPSAQLDGVAGSGSGAGFTSSTFDHCYYHYSQYSLVAVTTNNVTFNQCIFESSTWGPRVSDTFKPQFKDCYYENLIHPFSVFGIDSRNRAVVEIDGGWNQHNTDGGYIKQDGTAGVPFLHVENCDRVVMRGVQMEAANMPVVQVVEVVGTTQQIELECNPWQMHAARKATNVVTLANAIATTNGSGNLVLTWNAHGKVIGTVLDISGATSPLNLIAVNRPYWIVIAKTTNTLTLQPLLYPTSYVANATASGLGGASITVRWYGQDDWCHVVIPSRAVKFTDCDYETIRFSRTFNSIAEMSGGGDLYYEGQSSYKFDAFTYLWTMQLITDQPITPTNPATRYIEPKLAGAGFDTYVTKLYDHAGDSLAISPAEDMLYRVYPGQSLSLKIYMSGDQPEIFPRTETVDILVAKTRYTIATES